VHELKSKTRVAHFALIFLDFDHGSVPKPSLSDCRGQSGSLICSHLVYSVQQANEPGRSSLCAQGSQPLNTPKLGIKVAFS
jgi:hypothetical protein